MKARELMIGDWVYVSENFTQKYHKVRYIDADGVIGCLYVNEYGIECKSAPVMDYVQPIRLTKEIMFANGFKKSFVRGKLVHESEKEISVLYKIDHYEVDDWIVKEWSVCGIAGIEYVHEFQHYLRLVGKAEFADNFKI